MSENNNTGCGCPCNSKNTRMVKLVVSNNEFDAYINAAPKLYSEGGFVLGSLTSVREGEIHAECGGRRDEEDNSRGAAILRGVDGVIPTDSAIDAFFDLVVSGLDELRRSVNCGAIAGQAADHNSSPVVAESGAVTPDAPAMTVQENTGAGAVSPSVPAQPRFVAVGEYVYDRELGRFLDASPYLGGSQMIVERINSGHLDISSLDWEGAK